MGAQARFPAVLAQLRDILKHIKRWERRQNRGQGKGQPTVWSAVLSAGFSLGRSFPTLDLAAFAPSQVPPAGGEAQRKGRRDGRHSGSILLVVRRTEDSQSGGRGEGGEEESYVACVEVACLCLVSGCGHFVTLLAVSGELPVTSSLFLCVVRRKEGVTD